MILKGNEYGDCFLASGSLNFFGEGWKYDSLYKYLVPGFRRVLHATTFVAKTTTYEARVGNMPLQNDLQPKELLPDCIKLFPFKGAALNAVGLSGPGAQSLFARHIWQGIQRPFFLSFMAVKENQMEQMYESARFFELLQAELEYFHAPVGLQINISCPNTGHDTNALSANVISLLKMASELGIPIDLKINVFLPLAVIKEIEQSGLCDMLTISNTIPFGSLDTDIDWGQYGKESPLKKYGGGGLSGSPILTTVLHRIWELRRDGITMFIKGSGGIMHVEDVERMKEVGANAIEIGTVLMLRPWRAWSIVDTANKIFKKQ